MWPHLIREWLAQHVLVEAAREVCVHELPVIQGLAHQAAHKLEELKVADTRVALHNAVGVGLEGGAALRHVDKQRQVGVEDLASHNLQESTKWIPHPVGNELA